MNEILQFFITASAKLGLDYSFLSEAMHRDNLIQGALTTLSLCLLTFVFSLLVGIVLACALISEKKYYRTPARLFVEVTRNTPTLVQLYCAFLVLNLLITQAVGAGNSLSPFTWVVLVIALHKGVFHAEALRAGLQAVPATTLEAATSLGLNKFQQFFYVQLPLALRFALPSLINNLIDMVKMTAVASAIAVNDVTYASIMIWTQNDKVIEMMLLILAFYGVLGFLVNIIGRQLEARLRIAGYGH